MCIAEGEYLRKIEQLQPPQDGTDRNLDGLLFNLKQFHIPPQEQYAIILKVISVLSATLCGRGFMPCARVMARYGNRGDTC